MNKKILINMSNIHTGGGLQVAISFVSDLLTLQSQFHSCDIIISSDIYNFFDSAVLNNSSWNFIKYDVYGIKSLFSFRFHKILKDYDIIFTLFGPKYSFTTSKYEIVGFAQPWLLNSSKSVRHLLSYKDHFKFFVQSIFFKNCDSFIVELDHVFTDMPSHLKSGKDKFVVHNSISPVFKDISSWSHLNIEECDNFKIGFITRDYSHKNIKILVKVADILNKEFVLPFSVKFYFTLKDEEWIRYKHLFGPYGCSIGAININECPSFYESMDAMIFPSLLECFSASPLEAMYMGKPLFASDRGFVRDVCDNHAIYFDPNDASDIANSIVKYLKGELSLDIDGMVSYASNLSSSMQRTKKYLRILNEVNLDV